MEELELQVRGEEQGSPRPVIRSEGAGPGRCGRKEEARRDATRTDQHWLRLMRRAMSGLLQWSCTVAHFLRVSFTTRARLRDDSAQVDKTVFQVELDGLNDFQSSMA